ncbi:hypothetical protein GGF50DRAFT_116302 [Schizophyllum commune]
MLRKEDVYYLPSTAIEACFDKNAMRTEILTSLCPGCQRCVSCTGYPFSPSQDTIDAVRNSDESLGNFPDSHHRDRAMDADQQAHTLASEIDRLLSLTHELSAHRQRLLDFAAQQRAIAAPVRRLPDELLEKIFRLACAGVVFTYPLSKPMLAAACISHVCHRWRAIAMHDKQLWAPACIKLHKREIDKLPKQPTFKQLPPFQAALLAYLARSDPLPFAIDLQGGCIYPNGKWGPAAYVILPAAEFADAVRRRCHRARFCISSVDNLMWILRQLERSIILESLENLELDDRWMLTGNARDIVAALTKHAPRLRYWKQDIVDFDDYNHRVIESAPMHILVRLEASWTDLVLATRALSSCVNLQELVIGLFDITNTRGDSDRETMTLPQLESLAVVAVPVRTVLGRLLGVLTAPRLRHARFRCATPDDERRINRKLAPDRTDFPHAELAGFLERSDCVLESLALQGVCATPEDAVFVRERLPGATELQVED